MREHGGPTVEGYRFLIGKSQVRILPGSLSFVSSYRIIARVVSIRLSHPQTGNMRTRAESVSLSARTAVGAYGHWPRATGIRSSSWLLVIGCWFLVNCVCKDVHQPPITNSQQPRRARRRRTIIPWAESRDRADIRRRDASETLAGLTGGWLLVNEERSIDGMSEC